jgi:hypothetical protein
MILPKTIPPAHSGYWNLPTGGMSPNPFFLKYIPDENNDWVIIVTDIF